MDSHWYLLNAEFPGDGDTGVVDGDNAVRCADSIYRITRPAPLTHTLPKDICPTPTASRVLAEADVRRIMALDNCCRPAAVMRPDAEAPLVVADEVGVVLRHTAVVHHLRAARVADILDGQPLPVV